MKLTKVTNLLVLGLGLSVAAVGCHKRPVGVVNLPYGQMNQVAVPADNNNTPAPTLIPNPEVASTITNAPLAGDVLKPGDTPLPNPGDRKDWVRDAEIFKDKVVHFEFDSSVIKDSEKPKVVAVAEKLKASPQDAIEVDGHCDERGTEEYNRALGERRALAVREELMRLGVDATRIDTISYGKDRPVDTARNDEAYRKNRRGEFLLEVHPAK